jgi:hypothetical protein
MGRVTRSRSRQETRRRLNLVEQLRRLDKQKPEATFTNVDAMMNYLDDESGSSKAK